MQQNRNLSSVVQMQQFISHLQEFGNPFEFRIPDVRCQGCSQFFVRNFHITYEIKDKTPYFIVTKDQMMEKNLMKNICALSNNGKGHILVVVDKLLENGKQKITKGFPINQLSEKQQIRDSLLQQCYFAIKQISNSGVQFRRENPEAVPIKIKINFSPLIDSFSSSSIAYPSEYIKKITVQAQRSQVPILFYFRIKQNLSIYITEFSQKNSRYEGKELQPKNIYDYIINLQRSGKKNKIECPCFRKSKVCIRLTSIECIH